MITADIYFQIIALQAQYAHSIDRGEFETWVDHFVDDCSYKVISAENIEQGLSAGMMTCNSKAMLQDRVAYIRKAAIYNVHRDQHILSTPVIEHASNTDFEVKTGFAVYQSEPDRASRLFAVGHYHDIVVRVGSQLKFQSKIAILDNDSITPLLSSPI